MELDELHVDQRATGPQCQSVSVAGVLPAVRRNRPRAPDATGGEHDGGRGEPDARARLPPIAEGARDLVAIFEQPGDRAFHEHVDAQLDRALLKRPDHLQAGAVTDVRGREPPAPMTTTS